MISPLLGRLCDPKKLAENPDFIRLLGQNLAKLAIIYAVAIWLVIGIIGRAKNYFDPISG